MHIDLKDEIKTSRTEDGITTAVTVGKVENGWIVTKMRSGNRKVENKGGTIDGSTTEGEYFEESVTYISASNPLKKKEDVDSLGLDSLIKSNADALGMLIV